jgi:CO dehydrogenase/acetyl-CoA synthase alpha subunit
MADSATQAPVNSVTTSSQPSQVNLGGLMSGMDGEERALALLQVIHNGQTYDWKAFVPPNTGDLGQFVADITPQVLAEIDAKEAQWEALDPKTRTIDDPIMGQSQVVPIDKSEIVRPEIPDYYAKRRAEYPPLAEQLDAMWKGGQAQAEMLAKIAEVKNKYPKP